MSNSRVNHALLAGLFAMVATSANAEDVIVPSSSFVSVGDVNLHVIEAGEETPIVFVPGWTMTAEAFDRQLYGLSDAFRVLAYDPRGQGLSESTSENNTYVQRGVDLAALLGALQIDQAHLVGWSYGCYDVFEYIGAFGDAAALSITCIDVSPTPVGNPGDPWPEITTFEDLRFWYESFHTTEARNELATIFAEFILGDDAAPEDVQAVKRMHYSSSSSDALDYQFDVIFRNYTDLLSSTSDDVPFMYYVNSGAMENGAPFIKGLNDNIQVTEIPHHMFFYNRADEFNAEFRGWLNNLE